MWNPELLQHDAQKFIRQNQNSDLAKLILKGSPFPKVSVQEIAEQIKGLQKAKKKLPTWFGTKNILFPPHINLEQTSSETTAKYKANLVSGKYLIDLTGGFGVDTFFFSKTVDEITHCEINPNLVELAKHNFQQLSKHQNIDFITGNGLDILEKSNQIFDWIYLDPSRRSTTGNKVFRLEDCEPNVLEYMPLLFAKGKNILLKTAPLLDLKLGISTLKNVCEIHIVAVSNEVKELLWVLRPETKTEQIPIKTINFNAGNKEEFEGNLEEEQGLSPTISEPLQFLYEPNSAIMKSGLFNSVSGKFDLSKLHANSHLYTSEKLIGFPGRSFEILKILPFKPKLLKREFPFIKANIATRNFPQSVAQIKEKLGLEDGGNNYLFFTTDHKNQKIVLVCKKVV